MAFLVSSAVSPFTLIIGVNIMTFKSKEIISREIISIPVDFESLPIEGIICLDNVREDFSELDSSLLESVRNHGILEPLIVHIHPSEANFHLIAGERRLRAAKEAGLTSVPCMIYGDDLSEKEFRIIQLSENFLRKDLTPLEEAKGLKLLLDTGFSQSDLAGTLGLSQPYISNRLRLLDAPDKVKDLLVRGKITPSHVLQIIRYKDVPSEIYEKVVDSFVSHIESTEYPIPVHRLENPRFYIADYPAKGDGFIRFAGMSDYFKACDGCENFLNLGYSNFCLNPSCHKVLVDEKVLADKMEKESAPVSEAVIKGPDLDDLLREKVDDFESQMSDFIIDALGDYPFSLVLDCVVYLMKSKSYLFNYRLKDSYSKILGKDFCVDDLEDYSDSEIVSMFLLTMMMNCVGYFEKDDRSAAFSDLLSWGLRIPDSLLNFDFSVTLPDLHPCMNRVDVPGDSGVFYCSAKDHRVLHEECFSCTSDCEED